MTQLSCLYKHEPQWFSIDWHGRALHHMKVRASLQHNSIVLLKQSMIKMGSTFSYVHFLLRLSESHPLCVSPPGVYDEDSHWMVQVNRLQKLIDRLEQKVTSFPLTFSRSPILPVLLCLFH